MIVDIGPNDPGSRKSIRRNNFKFSLNIWAVIINLLNNIYNKISKKYYTLEDNNNLDNYIIFKHLLHYSNNIGLIIKYHDEDNFSILFKKKFLGRISWELDSTQITYSFLHGYKEIKYYFDKSTMGIKDCFLKIKEISND